MVCLCLPAAQLMLTSSGLTRWHHQERRDGADLSGQHAPRWWYREQRQVSSSSARNMEERSVLFLRSRRGAHTIFAVLRHDYFESHASRDENIFDKIIDQGLRFYPMVPKELCYNASCHRQSFLFGRLYSHANLDPVSPSLRRSRLKKAERRAEHPRFD